MLLLIPQRYEFSSKSQQSSSCRLFSSVVADTTKVRIFKQITTITGIPIRITSLLLIPQRYEFSSKSQQAFVLFAPAISCCWYHKGTNFQANHNRTWLFPWPLEVVADTTKVRIFKQITTLRCKQHHNFKLLLIPQRYEFSSKSQLILSISVNSAGCCWYHKGTNFQANHNGTVTVVTSVGVVADTTKVRIFKQITTRKNLSVID